MSIVEATPASSIHTPSIDDVLEVKKILFQTCDMPLELIDTIIDHAEYWPHTSVDTNNSRDRGPMVARGHSDVFIIRSLPLGLLPEQVDRQTHLGITDEFARFPPIPLKYAEPSESTKAATKELIEKMTVETMTNPIRGSRPCRKIVFTIWSHDQGWGGGHNHRGTFEGSYTWFDVGLERIEASDPSELTGQPQSRMSSNTLIFEDEDSSQTIPYTLRTIIPAVEEGKFTFQLLPPDNHIIRNRVAHKELQKNVITWSATDDVSPDEPAALELNSQGRGRASGNGEFVRNLRIGDVITLWSHARFPGWVNTMEYCKIDVYWAV